MSDKKGEVQIQQAPEAASSGAASAASNQKQGHKRRRRTRSHNSSPSPGRGFFVPGFGLTSSGQHRMMSLSELMDTAKGVTNMILAHEIAVDKNFRLENLKPEESPMEAEVKKVVHQAFWDVLDSQLKEDPPKFDQALSVLGEVKEIILSLLVLPQHQKLKDSIQEKFDLDLIRQQAENGVLDFESYAHYVLGLMTKLCAPVRDEEISQLRSIKEIVPLFRGIMKTLDNMKLDMANFTLSLARPFIVSKAVEYEREKFKEFLSEGDEDGGLAHTREWLKRHSPVMDLDQKQQKKLLVNRVLIDAFAELLEWDEYYPLPETLVMDHKRIVVLRDLTERASVGTAVILLSFSLVNNYIIPSESQRLKEAMKRDIDVLLEDFSEDADLLRILPNIAEQVLKHVNDYLRTKNRDPLPIELSENLKKQIAEMEDPNHRIRDLVQRRIVEFCKQAVSASRTAPLQVPPGLTLCQQQLGQVAGAFVNLVSYNRSVFGDAYVEIIENHVLFKDDNEPPSTSEDRKSRE